MRELSPDCVIIILTGYPDMETAEEGISLGIDDYIAKPRNLALAMLNSVEPFGYEGAADVLETDLPSRLEAAHAGRSHELHN
jgi:ActR/RegA family two-component response regulator